MSRAKYLWRLLDRRDRLVLAGVLASALLITAGVSYTTATLRAREAREIKCRERVAAEDARWRAKGLHVVRLAMPECAR